MAERWPCIEGPGVGDFRRRPRFLVSAPRAPGSCGACEISSGGGVPRVAGRSEAGSFSATPVVSVPTSETGWADPWLARPLGPRPRGLLSRGNRDPCNPGGTWPPPSHYDPVIQGDVSSWRRAATSVPTASACLRSVRDRRAEVTRRRERLAANDVRPFLHFEASDSAFSQRHFESSVGPDRVRHGLERDDGVGIGPDDDQAHGVHCTNRTRDSAADALISGARRDCLSTTRRYRGPHDGGS